jgi:hypothetical protein
MLQQLQANLQEERQRIISNPVPVLFPVPRRSSDTFSQSASAHVHLCISHNPRFRKSGRSKGLWLFRTRRSKMSASYLCSIDTLGTTCPPTASSSRCEIYGCTPAIFSRRWLNNVTQVQILSTTLCDIAWTFDIQFYVADRSKVLIVVLSRKVASAFLCDSCERGQYRGTNLFKV